MLLTQATAQAVHILSHPSLGVGKIICSLVEAGKVTRHTCLYMSLHVRTGQIVTKEERDGDRELRAKQPGESGEGRDPRWSCRSSHDRTAEIREMLNGFVTFTQHFVTKLNLRNLSTLHSAEKNL